ncbi:MAG: hypothetical protein U1F43_34050 [Myxococcota bacterium]
MLARVSMLLSTFLFAALGVARAAGPSTAPPSATAPSIDCEQVPMLRVACDRDRNAFACYQYALCLHEGDWVVKNDLAGADNLARACDLGLGLACSELAAWLESGWPPPVDLPAALVRHGQACALGIARSCVQAGLYHELGLAGHVDFAAAAASYSAGFARGDRDATVQLARLHRDGRAGYDGVGGPAWETRLQDAACGHDDAEACTVLAQRLRAGRGTSPDPARALTLARIWCAAGHGPACTLGGVMLADLRRPVDARVLLQRACGLEDNPGCARLGELLVACPGPTCERHVGLSLLVDACRHDGDPGACSALERERARDDGPGLERACRGPLRGSELCQWWCAFDPGAPACRRPLRR